MTTVSYVDDLLLLTGYGLKTSLTEVKKYLRSKGNPHKALQVFHITGTNGKGSVCQMLSQVLYKQYNKRVGLFLSPHLIRVNERIQINGELISDQAFNQYVGKIYEESKDVYKFSFFVIVFLASLFYFLDKKVDYVVCEVGLGGTWDATNIREHPLATFITSIGMDHQRILGPSLTQIQRNKMGIMKTGVPCYTSVDNDLMRRGAVLKKSSLRIVHNNKIEYRKRGAYRKTVKAVTLIPTSLAGAHQEKNAALVYYCLLEAGYDERKIKKGLQQVVHPGRCQWLASNILLDGAHNASGIEALNAYVDTVRHSYKKVITLFGSCKTAEEIKLFRDCFIQGDQNYLVKPTAHRGIDPKEIIDFLPGTFKISAKSPTATLHAIEKKIDQKTLVVIYGSLYLAGEILEGISYK